MNNYAPPTYKLWWKGTCGLSVAPAEWVRGLQINFFPNINSIGCLKLIKPFYNMIVEMEPDNTQSLDNEYPTSEAGFWSVCNV